MLRRLNVIWQFTKIKNLKQKKKYIKIYFLDVQIKMEAI